MDTLRLGRSIRALRRRLGWRQADLATRSGVSQSTISWIERGHAGGTSLDTVDSIARALDADIGLWLRWRGGDLDRLMDRGHAALGVSAAAQLGDLGWDVVAEVTYSEFGERGSIDLLAFHPETLALLVIELKTELVSLEETLRKHDAKTRLAATVARKRLGWDVSAVSRVLVLLEGRTARRRVADHHLLLDRSYPLRAAAIRRWLRRPSGSIGGLLFLPDTDPVGTRRRIRRKTAARASDPCSAKG